MEALLIKARSVNMRATMGMPVIYVQMKAESDAKVSKEKIKSEVMRGLIARVADPP